MGTRLGCSELDSSIYDGDEQSTDKQAERERTMNDGRHMKANPIIFFYPLRLSFLHSTGVLQIMTHEHPRERILSIAQAQQSPQACVKDDSFPKMPLGCE